MTLQPLPRTVYGIALVAFAVANVYVYHTLLAPRTLTVEIFNVGKGGAALVRVPAGPLVLIDTGSDASILRALGEALPPWQRSLDLVILTNTSAHTAGGLPALAERYHLHTLIRFGARGSPTQEQAFAVAARTVTHAHTKQLPYGARLPFSNGASAVIDTARAIRLFFGTVSFTISSSTAPGTHVL